MAALPPAALSEADRVGPPINSPTPKGVPMFVVVLTGDTGLAVPAPRAVGPFDDWDEASAMRARLIAQWEAEETDGVPAATVVRVEDPLPGVVVGEM